VKINFQWVAADLQRLAPLIKKLHDIVRRLFQVKAKS
jgi:hypothetical protein